MRIIVSDASCLIDLQRGGLLDVFLELPYEFVLPDMLFNDELLSFSRSEKALLRRHMTIAGLDGSGVERVGEVLASMPALSIHDGFAYVVAERRAGSILLTGDRRLRGLAEAASMEVHGVLWIVDELGRHRKASRARRLKALEIWNADPVVWLPRDTLRRMMAELCG